MFVSHPIEKSFIKTHRTFVIGYRIFIRIYTAVIRRGYGNDHKRVDDALSVNTREKSNNIFMN